MAAIIKLMDRVTDGLRNFASGLGMTGQDKTTAAHYMLTAISRLEIDACYRGTWLGRKIHDIPAKDMTREWRSWQADDDQIEAIEKEEVRLQIRKKVRKALVLSRLYGGAALVLGLPGDAATPAPKVIRKGQLRYVHVMNRHELTLGDQNRQLNEADLFGLPQHFQINSGDEGLGLSANIHPSRIVPIISNELPDGAMGLESESWFWGDPLLLSVRDALLAHDTSTGSIATLLNEAKIDIVHIPGLMDNFSTPSYEKKLLERITLANVIKSITNTLVLDGGDGSEGAGEKWEQRQMRWEGLPDIQRTMFQLVSGAADIPATRLIGQAPVGMNATGESDTRNYYDRLSSEQESDLTPALAPLDDLIIMSATGARDPSTFYEWRPLWQMTPTETATRDKTVAETTNIYAGLGLIPNDALAVAVQNRLIEDGVFPGLEAAIDEAELEADILAGNESGLTEPDPIAPNGPPQPANDPAPIDPVTGNSRRRAANDRARKRIKRMSDRDRFPIGDATPRPLYVSRKVLNASAIVDWAERQGFKSILPASKMHVTIIASRAEVDWLKVGGESWNGPDGKLTISAGGPRVVEPLGQAVVLLFNSWELSYRHGVMKEAGASWDFSEYQPHISISYDQEANAGVDLTKVEPYTGPIELGPEIFELFLENAIDDA